MRNITDYVLHELTHDHSPQPTITVFGDLNYDYIYSSPLLEGGREVLISDFSKNLAGAGGYVSCGLARLGAKVCLVADLGDDEDGISLFDEIGRHGVDRSGIRLVKDAKSPFTLIFAPEREKLPRQVATFLGTSLNFSIDGVDYREYVQGSQLVYSCNYFLLKRLREEIRFVFKCAKERNVLTSYDANAGDGWDDERTLSTLKKSIYPLTDIIFLNEREAWALTGEKDPARGIRLVHPGTITVVIKLGEQGSMIRHWDRVTHVSAFPLRGKVVDTVGAGDAFQAAFLYFYLRKLPVEICGILGGANAASTVLHRGGTTGQCNAGQIAGFLRYYRVLDLGGGSISIRL
jgi:sugar/nucleoside kinase (ribokinase family)